MELITRLSQEFTSAQDPILAIPMAAYMKNLFPYLGIKKPQRAVIQKELFKQHVIKTEKELIETLLLLWDKPEREYHYAACDLAQRYKKLWGPKILNTFELLIRTKSWWDTVDTLAKMVGILLVKYPQLHETMDSWIEDEYLWIRRVALIYQLLYKEDTDKERLFAYCEKTMHEKDFFIRKALGWSLRQYAKTNPQDVSSFISKHRDKLSPLSFREASKSLIIS
jgi:3-methyladenine DNA glycosylase AlkD